MQSNNGLQVSIVPDEDASILNFSKYLLDTNNGNTAGDGNVFHTGLEDVYDNGQSSQHLQNMDPFTMPPSILPNLTSNMSTSLPDNQWSAPSNDNEMDIQSGGQQLPPFQYDMVYTGLSPAPMMAQGNTTPSSKLPTHRHGDQLSTTLTTP